MEPEKVDILVIKAINGEEIIFTVVDQYENHINIKNACNILLQETNTGYAVALRPFMAYADGTITISRNAIFGIGDPDPALVAEYNKVYSDSPLIVPEKPSIILR